MSECENCGRVRVEEDGVCSKCLWDNNAHDFASVTRPKDYDTLGRILHIEASDPFGGPALCLGCGDPWPCSRAIAPGGQGRE